MKNDDPALQMPILIKDVQSKIIMIREQNVIVDADVARLYGVETRWINEAVHNNPEKFPETYMFQLDAAETEYLRSKFYLKFPKIQTLSGKLSWSHYTEIIKANSDLEIGFYTRQCENENWSVRELKRQMKSLPFHRIALSKDKKSVLEISKQGIQTQKPEDIVKDPYVLEFLGVNEDQKYLEGDIEEKVVANLQTFLLEFGKGFAFIGRQYKMQIGARQFKVDLVFYNYNLKCFVLIDLKRGEIEHYDVGQMNMYLNFFKKEVCAQDDNPPIGIVLGAYKDQLLMEYAMQGIENNLFVSKYQLYLPKREELQGELEKLLSGK